MEDKERRLSDIADLARAASAGDDAFAGAGIDVDAGEVRIWRVGGDKPAELASRYTKLGDESTPVRILPAVISRKQAVVLQEAVMRDYETLRAEGIEVQGWGMAPDRVFRIGVRDAQRHQETLLSRYGGIFHMPHRRFNEGKLMRTIFDTRDDPDPANRYVTEIDYAQRLTWGGEYIHAAPWSLDALGRRNITHGCVNVSTPDAQWLFAKSKIGDPVTVSGTERQLANGNGWTAWNLSWPEFAKGSALPLPNGLR